MKATNKCVRSLIFFVTARQGSPNPLMMRFFRLLNMGSPFLTLSLFDAVLDRWHTYNV